MKMVNVGDIFFWKFQGRDFTFRRDDNNSNPLFECERFTVTRLTDSFDATSKPFTFFAEAEWFAQRGFKV